MPAARFPQLAQDRRAVTALEYGLIAALTVAVGLAAVDTIGGNLAANVTAIGAELRR